MATKQYTLANFKSDTKVTWCPGCGDFAILSSLQKTMVELGLEPHETVVVSGIGCSSRLPYFMATYGFHTIHGRGSAIASGVKIANPRLSVWQITGDGDCLAIGGNHFIHAVRRNVDLNIVLMNNRIYGLTKGQFSPTTEKGFVSKSSPFGTIEEPFEPAELTIGARGQFFARSIDVDMPTTQECMTAGANHQGASVIEILQNCVIFADGIHDYYSVRESRAERTINLKHGEKMIFGANRDKGIMLEGLKLKVVTIGENGITENDLLTHDATDTDNTMHYKIAMMHHYGLPLAMGVIRNVEAAVYDQEVERQIAEVQAKKPIRKLTDFLLSKETWEVI
jgi:2-oxoglutarate ferredoxin oxidoreductase subunit beta